MRKNLPVSQREYPIGAEETLLSATDLKGRITYANEAFVRVSGFERAELYGAPHNLVRHPDMPPEAFKDMWTTIGRGRSWKGLVKNRRKDGSLYHEEMTITPIWDADAAITHFVAVKQDITARKEAELALETYRMFFHNARDKMFLLDTDGIIIAANQAVALTYGYTAEELQGLSIRELRAPETLGDWPEQLETARTADILFETLHQHKDGTAFPVEVRSCQAVLDGKKYLLSIVRDISVRRKAEQEACEAQQRAAQAERMALIGTMAAAIFIGSPRHAKDHRRSLVLRQRPSPGSPHLRHAVRSIGAHAG